MINPFQAKTWFSVGARRRPKGWLAHFTTVFAIAVGIFVVYAATFIIVKPWTLGVIFLSGIMTLAFLMVGAREHSDPETPSPLDWLFSIASFASGLYFAYQADIIEQRIVLLDPLTQADLVFGTIIFLLTLEITRRSTGLGLTTLVLVFVGYNFFGHLLSGVLQHGYIDYHHFLEITVFTTDGIFGLPVRVAATYAFMFVMFGTLLHAVGGGDFFFDFAAAISGRQPGGPAKVAVVSSGLYGMISGSPTADVVTTGSITIPIMKRLGYTGTLAGAVEVAASTGGSLVPPVMGSAAFIMAEFTDVDYKNIAIAALLPALLYYISVYSQVHFASLRLGLRRLNDDQIPYMLPTLKQGGLFLVPLVVLTAALMYGYTPTMVAVFGTLSVLAVAMVRQRTRIGFIKLIKVLAETCFRIVPVAGACAAAGLVIGGITMTGLAPKFAHVIYAITNAQLFPTLLLAAALSVILGLGMPTPSAYILAAVLMGPMLEELGVPVLGAHMFLLYYAVMSALTPPVAVAAYAASSIADANPLHVAALAVRFALAAFIVPFAFIYGPELLLEGWWLDTIFSFAAAAVGLIILAIALEGFFRNPLPIWLRFILGLAAIGLIIPIKEMTVTACIVLVPILFFAFVKKPSTSRSRS